MKASADGHDGYVRDGCQRRIGARQDVRVAAAEAWFLGGPIDGRLMAVEMTAEGSLPEVVMLPQTGLYVDVDSVPTAAVEHVYVLAEWMDDVEVYQYRQMGLDGPG
jgi:hypothetical protein